MKIRDAILLIAVALIIALLYFNLNKQENTSESYTQRKEEAKRNREADRQAVEEARRKRIETEQIAAEAAERLKRRVEQNATEETDEETDNQEQKTDEEVERQNQEEAEKEKREKIADIKIEKGYYERYMAVLKNTKWPKTEVTSENFEPLMTNVPKNDAKLKELAAKYVFLVAVKEKQKDVVMLAMKQLDEKVWQDLLAKVAYPCRYCQDTGLRPCRKCHGSWKCKNCKGSGKEKTTQSVKVGERTIYTKYGKYDDGVRHYRTVPQYKTVEVEVDCKYCKGIGHCRFCEKGKVACDEPHNKFASINQEKIIDKINSSRKELYSYVAKKIKKYNDVIATDDGKENVSVEPDNNLLNADK